MDINEKLLESILNKDIEQVKECLAQGADVNTKNKNGKTALMELAHKGHLEHLEIAKLLIKHGADVNARDCNDWNPLMIAVNRGYMSDSDKQSLEFAKLLIENGADVNAKDKSGDTALMTAICNNTNKAILETTQLLIQHGVNVNVKNNKGRTALDYIISLQKLYAEQDFKGIKNSIVSKGGKLGSQVKTNTINKSKTKQKSNNFERGM